MWFVFLLLLVPFITGALVMLLLSVWLIIQHLIGWGQKPITGYPKVGIMVPHYNEEPERLLRSLEALEKQAYPERLTVFLVDDGSTNDIQKHLEPWLRSTRKQEYRSLRFDKNNGSKGKAMDAALPFIPEDIEALVVLDSDTFLEEESVIRLVERLWQDDKCAAVCGFVVPVNHHDGLLSRLQYFEHIGIYPAIKLAQDLVGRVAVMAGAFVVHRMSVVRSIGGWSRWIVEDIAWTWVALASGYRTGYAPDAVAYTYCPTTAQGLFRQRRRWARGRVEAFRAAWQVSKLKGLLLSPLFVLWLLSLVPPTLFLMPILAIVYEQWWVFGVMAASTTLYLAMFQLYQLRLPARLRKGIPDMMRSTFYNTLFELVLWRPNLLGACDEFLGKTKIWLTR